MLSSAENVTSPMTSKSKRPDADEVLRETCYLKGPTLMQDAHFTLLPSNVVSVVIHEGGISGRDSVLSMREARKVRDRLLGKGWKLVSAPRRTEAQLRSDMEDASREFLARPTRIRRELDPDANLVPPEAQMQRQRERLSLSSAASTTRARVLLGGAFETNKRRH
jgi:hypothetical protein